MVKKQSSVAKKTKAKKKVVAAELVALPSVLSLTSETIKTLFSAKRLFGLFALLMITLALLMVGAQQQTQYTDLREAMAGLFGTTFGSGVREVSTLYLTVIDGTLNSAQGEGQKIYVMFVYLLTALAAIWLLRHVVAKTVVTVRDGLYNAGSPIVSVVCLALLGLAQMIPLAIAVLVTSAASTSGVLSNLLVASVIFVVDVLLIALSLYWMTRTVFALVIATIPGTYPMAAFRSAREVVSGRRLPLLVRLLWLGLFVSVIYSGVALLAISLTKLEFLAWLPLMPVVLQMLNILAIIFSVAYLYILYRKAIDARA